jgi:NAD(P)-dependent dehydrogenase (short-subunit alcohol dehydrogenase family)
MRLKDQKAVVTGGSRGLGLGLVEALVEAGAKVTVVARGNADLTAVHDRLGVATIAADVTDADAARTILAEVRPEVLALNAGAPPRMGPLHELSWEDFTAAWETDVKAGLYWMQAALKTPLAPGSRILVGSSGAALKGSPLSGGYAGAKRMLWTMASYANGVSNDLDLGLQFQVLVPLQMIDGTGVGRVGAEAYARRMGVTPEVFLARFGAPMPPRQFGDHVVSLLTERQYVDGLAFGLRGDTGITLLDGAAA